MNMSRFGSLLGIGAVLLLGVFVVALANAVPLPYLPVPAPSAASSTLSVVPSVTMPSLALPDLDVSTTPIAQAESVQQTAEKKPSAATASSSTAVTSAPLPPAPGAIGLDASATNLRSALVNILCFVTVASGLHSISGSGVVIDPKGVILTNAHIAQYFLLADRGATCTIRAGSPATNKYEAALIYISPPWLQANPTTLTQSAPSGTGEYDFALLAVTKSITNAALPTTFPSVPLATTPPNIGTPVVIASYGAQFLETSQIQSSLFPTVVFGSVKDIFTFKVNTIDVLALGGSAAAQEGSSGGGVADARGELVGTITTSTVTGATDTRALSSITASYVRAEYASETGSALDILLAKPTAVAVAEFAPKIPTLEAILIAHLP